MTSNDQSMIIEKQSEILVAEIITADNTARIVNVEKSKPEFQKSSPTTKRDLQL
jgi:hypothetical protein